MPETGEFVGRGKSGLVTVMKNIKTCLLFILTTTNPNRLKHTVQDSESDPPKPLIGNLGIVVEQGHKVGILDV